jgi:hypothetical protein
MMNPKKVLEVLGSKTDCSKTGWDGVVENTTLKTGDFWSYEEQQHHIISWN